MKIYLDQVRRRVNELKAKIFQIIKGENEQANRLAKATSAEHMTTLDNVLYFVQLSPLIDTIDVPLIDTIDVQEIGSKNNWIMSLISYLKNEIGRAHV